MWGRRLGWRWRRLGTVGKGVAGSSMRSGSISMISTSIARESSKAAAPSANSPTKTPSLPHQPNLPQPNHQPNTQSINNPYHKKNSTNLTTTACGTAIIDSIGGTKFTGRNSRIRSLRDICDGWMGNYYKADHVYIYVVELLAKHI
jgi:hypothetical protein